MNSTQPRREFLTQSALAFIAASAGGFGAPSAAQAAQAGTGLRRSALAKPGPMLPPSPAILTSVRGKPGDPDELAVLWTFVAAGLAFVGYVIAWGVWPVAGA